MGLGGPSQHIAHEERIRAWPRARTASSEYPQTAMVATAPASIAMHLPVHPAISSDPCEKSFQRPSAAGRPDRCFANDLDAIKRAVVTSSPACPPSAKRSSGRDQPPAHPRRCVCAQLNARTRALVTIGTRLAVAHGIRSPLSVSWSSSKARHGCDSNYLPGRSTCRARSKLRRQSIGSKPCRF
jgi:hypothetical protein